MSKILAEKLREAAKLIELGWTQGASARDARNKEVDIDSVKAVSFCAGGAIARVSKGYDFALQIALEDALDLTVKSERTDMLFSSFIDWNDESKRTKSDVLAMFEKAAKEEETSL